MRTKLILLSACSSLLLFSCNREDNEQSAGKGGNAILNIVPKHHGVYKNIINGKVYIKYNAQDAVSIYDDSAICNYIDGEPTARFTGLKKGKYYLYGTGEDTSIFQSVKGGMPYEISAETTLNISLAVTEGD